MKAYLYILGFGICYLGFAPATQGQTAQQKERQAEKISEPRLFVYDTTYLASVQAEREEFLRQKILIDCLDISDKKREKLIRDLYKHKRSKRLNKILLTATTFEEEVEVTPEHDK
ncbi:MAG: hypothetical protein KJO04_00380 [Bacteroidia bacterium]|nr:hypothetical protein [Bacteroidia bacterium]